MYAHTYCGNYTEDQDDNNRHAVGNILLHIAGIVGTYVLLLIAFTKPPGVLLFILQFTLFSVKYTNSITPLFFYSLTIPLARITIPR